MMTKRKSKFLTVIFSIIPGVGHMYLGFMKHGISILASTCALCFLVDWLQLGVLMFLFPLIWFYGFFDALNKSSLSDEEFYQIEDRYLFQFDQLPDSLQKFTHGKTKLIAGVFLIYAGVSILYNNILHLLRHWFGWDFLSGLDQYVRRLPQLVLAFAIIAFGLYLIRGKKKELEEEFTDYQSSQAPGSYTSSPCGKKSEDLPTSGPQMQEFYSVEESSADRPGEELEDGHENL